MEWQDEGIILYTQTLGERKQIISLFTPSYGRCAGILSINQKNKAWLHCGSKINARWCARLESHLGYWTLEPLQSTTAFLLDAPGPLAALLSGAALCYVTLPERQAYPGLYKKFEALIRDLCTPHWERSYVFFELILLEELGYGLDLKTCAVTGVTGDLVAVSPRTGRAVCKNVAQPYKGRLLPLPSFISRENDETHIDAQEILDALHLSGYFLERHLLGHTLPSARGRLLERFTK